MFIKKNPYDKPHHHKELISKADASKVFAPILLTFSCVSFLAGVLLVFLVIGFVAPDKVSAVASIVGMVIFSILTLAYFVLRQASNKHKRYLAKFGIGR